MYTRDQYLEIIRLSEAKGACEGNLNKAKELYASGDLEALHRIVVGCQDWLRNRGIIKDPLSGIGETWHPNGQLSSHGTFVDGNRHGVFECFHSNGQLRSHSTYLAACLTHTLHASKGAWEW
jgi:antitoxin component YwqK of YwqJK toxin-antitoxin module